MIVRIHFTLSFSVVGAWGRHLAHAGSPFSSPHTIRHARRRPRPGGSVREPRRRQGVLRSLRGRLRPHNRHDHFRHPARDPPAPQPPPFVHLRRILLLLRGRAPLGHLARRGRRLPGFFDPAPPRCGPDRPRERSAVPGLTALRLAAHGARTYTKKRAMVPPCPASLVPFAHSSLSGPTRYRTKTFATLWASSLSSGSRRRLRDSSRPSPTPYRGRCARSRHPTTNAAPATF